MAKNKEQYKQCHESVINKNCKVQFNRRVNGELHLKFFTFDNEPVVLTESTFLEIRDAYLEYKAMDLTENGQR